MIPLNQMITVNKDGGLDAWGEATVGASVSYPGRVNEKTELVRDTNGEEVVTKATVYLKGFVNVDYSDSLSWAAEDGKTRTERPLNISFKRDLAGKILFTKVAV